MEELKTIIKSLRESFDPLERDYGDQWKEAGLKSVLVVPVLKSLLEYNPLLDMAFEAKLLSTGGEYLDILLQDSLVVEVKRFNLLSNDKKRKKARKEIRRYLTPDDNIFFGILTDGAEWEFFMERRFIERYGNDGQKIPLIRDEIPLCFTFNSFDDGFLDDMRIFHSKGFFRNMKFLAKCIAHRALRRPGAPAWHNLFSTLENAQRQKICGDNLRAKIEDTFRYETGEYFEQVNAKELRPGVKFQWEDDFLRLGIIVQSNGAVKIDLSNTFVKPEKQHGVLKPYPNIIEKLFNTWVQNEEDCIYGTRIELLRDITGKKAIFGQDKFLAKWAKVD